MTPPASVTTARAEPRPKRAAKPKWRQRGWWMRQVHQWHYVSAALSLAGMLLFAATGLTLNHAASIGATPVVTSRTGRLPAPLLAQLRPTPSAADAPLPPPVAAAVKAAVGLDPGRHGGEWSADEVYVAMPRPGGDAWVSVKRATGEITSERTDRGWISYLNDLHKGRNAGPGWGWFIDAFAAACIVFTATGLALLYFLARGRRATWPLVGASFALPILVAILFIH